MSLRLLASVARVNWPSSESRLPDLTLLSMYPIALGKT